MIRATKTLSSLIESGKRFVKFLRLGKSDIQTAREAMPYGTDSAPIKDLVAIHAMTGEKGKTVIIGYINKEQLASPGEHRIFSTDQDGNLQTYIWLTNDGCIEVGGTSDFMVRYSALESAFNELRSDFNNLVTKYNSHIHITTATVGASPTPGVISPTTSTEVLSTADISGAKIDEVKTL